MWIEKWHKRAMESEQREREGGREGVLKPLTVQYNMQIRLHYIDVSAYAQLCARGREREREYECDCVCVCVWQHV